MRNLITKRKSEGFTIIEVMIVLAIAALILLIVLLAVPALQRNSRNTTIKNDVGTVAGAINTYESDYNGTPPTNIKGTGTITLATGDACAGTTNPETVNVNGSTKVVCATTVPTAKVTPGEIDVYAGYSCPTDGTNLGAGQKSSRAFSLYYSTEISGGTAPQCTDT